MAVETSTASTRSSLELERKYDVDPDVPVPAVDGLVGVASTTAQEHLLDATYFDTDDLVLRAAGITLRHRTGGTDAGWHLKLPAGRAREEITVDAGPGEVPQVLAGLVRSRVRSRDLRPVAALTTRRVARRLLAADGTPLAEIADDTVVARPLPTGPELVWREWEVELLQGDEDLLVAVQERLLPAGATPATATSKLGRVLPRPAPPGGAAPWWSVAKGRRRRPTAGSAVQAHLAEQVAELVARDPHTRRDVPDALHKMRVATRRLRSALATFGPLLDRTQTDPLRDELRWLAGVLGAARDAEVMHARLRTLVAAEPQELVLGEVQDRVDTVMTRRHRAAHDTVQSELDGERYLHLLDALDELVAEPPFLPDAGRNAEQVLRRLVRRTWRRLDKTMIAAERAPRGAEKDALLHEVRKDAKRTRYAAEAVVPVFRSARRYAKGIAELQESLGDFQDGVVTRTVLRELGELGDGAGFTFGRLHALEQVRAEAAVDRWPHARAVVSRRRLRRWLEE